MSSLIIAPTMAVDSVMVDQSAAELRDKLVAEARAVTGIADRFEKCPIEAEVINGLKYLVHDRKWENIFALEPAMIEWLQKAGIKHSFDHIQLTDAHVGITGCEALIARLGSVMVSTGQMAGRQIFVYPEIHIVIAHASQLVPDIKEALARLRKKYNSRIPSMVTLITGPSRTADIEKTLVMGAHGPKELYVFLLEDR